MYDILKSVISAGGYKLAEIQRKIKKLFVLGDLTEEQADELLALATAGATPDSERPAVLDMLQSLAARIEALEKAQGGVTEPSDYEAWQRWDGISKKYHYGAIVRHTGKLWFSNYKGQNVWEPGAPGTEAIWVEYKEE